MNQNIGELFDQYYNKYNFSGAALVKQGDNTIYSGAYGYAHRGFRVMNTIDTMFDTASITKVFTAVAVLQLADKGLLKLNDRIADIIDLRGTQIPDDVTITHLLTHTSGIADDADEEAGESYEDLFINKPNYSIRNCIDFLPQFAYKRPNFKAGTDVRYNNCAYVLLGLAIEKLTGTGYREYVTENIFNACGMGNTAFYSKDAADARVAEGYSAVYDDNEKIIGWTKNIYSYPPIGTPDGGAFTSVYDLDAFIRAIKGGRLLSRHYSSEMMKPQCGIEKKYGWGKEINGYGLHFRYDNNDKLVRIHKDGSNPGVAAIMAYYPDIDTTSIILANQDCNVWEINRKVEQIILYN